jgi:hypothetical protein
MFHGTTAPTTPVGSLQSRMSWPKRPGRRSSQSMPSAMSAKALSRIIGSVACENLENEMGEPISAVMSWAISLRRPR